MIIYFITQREENLSIKDKMFGVSIILRFHYYNSDT